MGIFLVTFFVLAKVFFKPYVALFDARDEAQGIDRSADAHGHGHDDHTGGDETTASTEKKTDAGSLGSLKSRVEALTAELHAETASMRNAAMDDANSNIQSMMKDAGDKAAETIAAAQDRVDGLRDEVWNSLVAEKQGYLSRLQEKLLA